MNAWIHLEHDEIHVWCVWLNEFSEDLARLEDLLSADERVRASNFRFASDRNRFIASRGILRELLARYLNRDAATIQFSYGRFGKPDLAGSAADPSLYFNMSHSGALAAYAVTRASPVGVDVEQLREIPELEAVASCCFTPTKTNRLMSLPSFRRLEEFFADWTCHEAVLKAAGEGLSASPQLRWGGRDEDSAGPGIGSDWRLWRLSPAPGYIGAVALSRDSDSPALRARAPATDRRSTEHQPMSRGDTNDHLVLALSPSLRGRIALCLRAAALPSTVLRDQSPAEESQRP